MPVRELFGGGEIAEAVQRLGDEISGEHREGVVLVGVLKGAVTFLADLVRAVTVPVAVDFLSVSRFAPDSGRIRILKDLDDDIEGKPVILVEDIIDTGLSSTYLVRQLGERNPSSLRVCTLLDRTRRRIVPIDIHYRGFELEDAFVLGYGLDFAERYRNLGRIVVGDLHGLQEDPDLHVEELYGSASHA